MAERMTPVKNRGAWQFVKAVVSDFFDDDAMTLGAALAFYTVLSLAPLLVLLLWIAGTLGDSLRQRLIEQVTSTVGAQAGEAVQMIVENAARSPSAGTIAGILGIIMLIFSATGVFVQLQHALNMIWDVRAKPGGGIGAWVRKRLLSLGMILAVGFLLIVSLAVSAVLTGVTQSAQRSMPGGDVLWEVLNIVVTIAVFAALFALMFKYLPDVEIAWHDVWVGAFLTAILFAVGKYLIGLYLGRSSVGSTYGAAGSLVVLLVWVYYVALVFFLGAEITQVYARWYGRAIVPDEHAVRQTPSSEPARA